MSVRRSVWGCSELRCTLALAILGVMATACSSDKATSPSGPPPAIVSATISANSFNTLSEVVTFTATNADSARVVYSAASDPGGMTPGVVVSGGQGRVVTLGLLPLMAYTHILQVFGRGNRMVADTLQVTTADLP